MKPISYVIILTAASATGSWLFAAEPQPTPQEKPAATAPAEKDKQPAAEQSREEAAAESDSAESKKSSADKASAAKGSPQRFIPSEQVRADFDVSFPVDI